ncbi:MAG: hypothetical protein GY810_12695 [Aureispira sp.]|nr:hypothetical protein [Aureispira sp.]
MNDLKGVIDRTLLVLVATFALLGILALPMTWDVGAASSITLKGTLLDWLKWESWGALPTSNTGEIVEASMWPILGYIACAVLLWDARTRPIEQLKMFKLGILLSLVLLLKTLVWGWLNSIAWQVQFLDCGIILWIGFLVGFVYVQIQHLCTRNQVFLC